MEIPNSPIFAKLWRGIVKIIKGKYYPCVVDATAGLGTDSFMLAALGCDVTMLERTNVVCALLYDGLVRGRVMPQSAEIVQRMRLLSTEVAFEYTY